MSVNTNSRSLASEQSFISTDRIPQLRPYLTAFARGFEQHSRTFILQFQTYCLFFSNQTQIYSQYRIVFPYLFGTYLFIKFLSSFRKPITYKCQIGEEMLLADCDIEDAYTRASAQSMNEIQKSPDKNIANLCNVDPYTDLFSARTIDLMTVIYNDPNGYTKSAIKSRNDANIS